MILDSHHHLWNYTSGEFGWVTDEMAILRRDFLPADLEQVVQGTGIVGTVAVQARTCLEETDWLLHLAARHPLIKGVVGWLPLKDPDVGAMLDRLVANPLFRGLREVLQGTPDAQFFDCPDFNRGLRELTARGVPFDLLIFHHQLARATGFVDDHPDQRFILDHIAKPEIRRAGSADWRSAIGDLARRPNVFCKFSGVTTEVREDSWDVGIIRPYFETVLEAFGEDRVMFGSDWPVCLLRSDYARWISATREVTAGLTAAAQEAFFFKNAYVAYGLRPERSV